MLAVARDHQIVTHAATRRAIDLAVTPASVGLADPQRRCRLEGPPLVRLGLVHVDDPEPGEHRLLIRRNLGTGELAFYRCWTPQQVPLAALVRVAGLRWRESLVRCPQAPVKMVPSSVSPGVARRLAALPAQRISRALGIEAMTRCVKRTIRG